MAAVVIKGFAGMRPAMNPRLLETGESQNAKNAKLNNGSLRPMKQTRIAAAISGTPGTIYRYGDEAVENQYWLQFTGDVDVMKSPVHSDQYRRLYWTDGTYPKYAPESLFLGAGTLPSGSYRLGIPKPGVKPSVNGSAVPTYTKENREYVVTFTKTGEETAPSDPFKVSAVDTYAVKITGIPAAPTGYTGKKLYRRVVGEADYKFVANLGTTVTEYEDSVANASLGAVLGTTAVINVALPPTPGASHAVIDFVDGAKTRQYAYSYGGYYVDEDTGENIVKKYVDEDNLSNVASVSADETQSVTITGFATAPAGATYRRIYRRDATSGNFYRIAQIPVSLTSYTDSTPTPVGTGQSTSFTSGTYAAPTLSASASTGVSSNSLTAFVYAITHVTTGGVESKRSKESNTVRVVNGVTEVTVAFTAAPDGITSTKIYRRTATVTNGVLGGGDSDFRLVATVPGSQTSYIDKATAASIAGNAGLPAASQNSTVKPTSVVGSATIPADVIPDTRVYVYTFVSEFDEEGPPSDPSDSVDVDPSKAVTISAMAVAPSGPYRITKKRIYRSSTGNQSTAYQFVAEVAVATTSYSDSVDQTDLGEVLPSESWIAPPDAMIGLTLGANGIAAGFVDKTVHISEAFLPHAWPAKYQQTTEHKVVGIAAFQQSFAVLTTSYPYILTGADPASMSMVKLEAPQACSSKKSICSTGTGVIYASPDGLVSIGTEGIKLLTHGLLNREQWQAYTPSSMMVRQYNSKIYVFHATGLIVFDFTGESASMTVFDQTADSAFYDAILDGLFIGKNGTGILRWDSATTNLTYLWKSKLYTIPQPVNFAFAQVEADAYPVTCRVYAGGTLRHTQTVSSRDPFRLPSGFVNKDWEIELEGTQQIFQVAIAQSIQELRGA